MTVDFATLAVGDKVAWVSGDSPGCPWMSVRFGTVARIMKTRTVVRFGAEEVAWRCADKRYGAGQSTMGCWDHGQFDRLVTVDEGCLVAAAIREKNAVVSKVRKADLYTLAERGRRCRTADDARDLAAALRAAADVLEGR